MNLISPDQQRSKFVATLNPETPKPYTLNPETPKPYTLNPKTLDPKQGLGSLGRGFILGYCPAQ